MSDVKWTDVGSLIVAVAIPVVLHMAATELGNAQEINAKEFRDSQVKAAIDTRTLERMRQLDSVVSKAIYEKSKIDEKNDKSAPDIYQFSYVNENPDIVSKVLVVLNEYEELCAGANMKLYNNEIIETLRGDSLQATFTDYEPFIHQWRKGPKAKNAWEQCEKYLANKL